MIPCSIQFQIHVKDKDNNPYRVDNINPNEMCAVQELLTYRSTWINIVGGFDLHALDVHLTCPEDKPHVIQVNAQLQIVCTSNINMDVIIETGKRNFNNYLVEEQMRLANDDLIQMSLH